MYKAFAADCRRCARAAAAALCHWRFCKKKAGVSAHFLKFYEEKGILHPKVQENGYRHYDIRDASLVLECRRMKNMGLSVKEVEKGINDCTPEQMQQLAAQEKVLLAQLQEQQLHLQGLQNLRAALRFCAQEEWSVHTVPDVWFLPHTLNREFVQDNRIYDQLPGWLDWMPLVTSAQVVRCTTEGQLLAEWGLGVEQDEAELIYLEPGAPARLLPMGRVLEMYCSWDESNEDGEKQMYQRCMTRAQQLNLVPTDTLFRKVFCYTAKDDRRWVHCVLRVPVSLPDV